MKQLKLEFFKGRRQHLPVVEAAVLVFLLLYFWYDFGHTHPEDGWKNLLYVVPLMNGMLFPLVMAVLASRICEAEHKGHTFKLLETMMRPASLFDAKLGFGMVHILLLCVLEMAEACVCGALHHFAGPLPLGHMLAGIGICFAVSTVLFTMQLGLSLLIANQLVPLTVGVAGSFLGMFLMFFPQTVEKLLPWGYYGVLMQVGMLWNQETRTAQLFWADFDFAGLALLGVWFGVLLAGFRTAFAKKEV